MSNAVNEQTDVQMEQPRQFPNGTNVFMSSSETLRICGIALRDPSRIWYTRREKGCLEKNSSLNDDWNTEQIQQTKQILYKYYRNNFLKKFRIHDCDAGSPSLWVGNGMYEYCCCLDLKVNQSYPPLVSRWVSVCLWRTNTLPGCRGSRSVCRPHNPRLGYTAPNCLCTVPFRYNWLWWRTVHHSVQNLLQG